MKTPRPVVSVRTFSSTAHWTVSRPDGTQSTHIAKGSTAADVAEWFAWMKKEGMAS